MVKGFPAFGISARSGRDREREKSVASGHGTVPVFVGGMGKLKKTHMKKQGAWWILEVVFIGVTAPDKGTQKTNTDKYRKNKTTLENENMALQRTVSGKQHGVLGPGVWSKKFEKGGCVCKSPPRAGGGATNRINKGGWSTETGGVCRTGINLGPGGEDTVFERVSTQANRNTLPKLPP